MKFHKTAKGTELPILNLRGKDYLEVKYRIVWFREDHPDWGIETQELLVTDKEARVKALIKDPTGRIIASGTKTETLKGFPDFVEKSETGAIGRALALIGYGTQFCGDELDEGDRLVDSPVQKTVTVTSSWESQTPPSPAVFVIPVGKNKGKTIGELEPQAIENYVKWAKEQTGLKGPALETLKQMEKYLNG
jgi:hypothetical protein